jgi:hypothetical protein
MLTSAICSRAKITVTAVRKSTAIAPGHRGFAIRVTISCEVKNMKKRAMTMIFLFAVTFALTTPWATSQQEQPEEGIPAFHAAPPERGAKLPALLSKDQLWGENSLYPYQSHAYELAAKVENVIYQQPCYCYCDRMGHKSLHSCFENTHGAECSICMKELYYTFVQHKNGRTARQIRQGIIRGDWKQVDLRAAATIN